MLQLNKIKSTITIFMSNRTNLTIVQCLLYFLIGYIMGQYLSWPKLFSMYIILLGIQFITRTKAVADGMMFKHLMDEQQIQTNEFLKHMKREADRINKKDLNQFYNILIYNFLYIYN